jgi:hypothetical protein
MEPKYPINSCFTSIETKIPERLDIFDFDQLTQTIITSARKYQTFQFFAINYLILMRKFDQNLRLIGKETKKSDALVGRVNTFIILHTKSFKIAFKIWRPLNLQISKVSFSHSESEFVWEVLLGLKILDF